MKTNNTPLMVSISGLRGIIGQSLSPSVACDYATVVGNWFSKQQRVSSSPAHIVLGRDSRPSGQMIQSAVVAGLLGAGCRVTQLGIVTTPGVAVMIQHLRADGGMVITASHNPVMWNGIKTLSQTGNAPPASQAQKIIDAFAQRNLTFVDAQSLEDCTQDPSTHQVHIDKVLKQVNVDLIRKSQIKVVVDSVHGAGGQATARLLDKLEVEYVHLYAEPTGQFPHTPEPTKENLVSLCDQVTSHQADVGFAQDPDADRLAIVDEQGRYIGEEYTLALCCLHYLQIKALSNCTLAANLSTSRMIDDIAGRFDSKVIRTPVGEAHVAQAISEHQAALGGEGNGGIILPDVCMVRNSLVGMALILELLAMAKQPLSAIVKTFPAYHIVKYKVNLKSSVDGYFDKELVPLVARHFKGQQIDLQDGVRVDWPDRWVHVRSSNTEPIVRIIAEATQMQQAEELVGQVKGLIQ